MHDHELGNGYATHQGIAQLSHSLEKTLDQNRVLLAEMTRFAKDESLRFAHMQLDHADQAFAHFRDRRDLTGLIGAQQEWFREMMQEYANQSLRYAEMFQALTRHVQSHVENAVSELQDQAEESLDGLDRDVADIVDVGHGTTGEQSRPQAE
jgi:DNA anti-recombination protein RmuC